MHGLLRLISVGLVGAAIGVGSCGTTTQAQGISSRYSVDPAQREAFRTRLRADMDKHFEAAREARLRGDCKGASSSISNLRRVVERERLYSHVYLSPRDREDLTRYSLDLINKLPSDCPPRDLTNQQPVEYVKICKVGGDGFFNIPGTDICLPLSNGVQVEMSGSAVGTRVSGHVQRIARDQGGSILYDLGNESQEGSGAGFNLGVRVPIGQQFFGQTSYVSFAYSYFRVTGDGSGGQATTPDFILFPGLGVGANPNGFAAGGTMPFSYRYDFTQQRHGVEIAAGFEVERGPVEYYPWFGVRFGSNTVDDTYTVSRPLPVAINATYTTDSTVNSLGIFAGLSVSVQPPGSPIELFAQGRAGIDSNWADTDVKFNIVFPGTDETQRVSLSEQKFTPYLFLEAGFKAKLGPVQIRVSGFAEHGGYMPSVSIPGGGSRPELDGETSTIYGAKFSLIARLN